MVAINRGAREAKTEKGQPKRRDIDLTQMRRLPTSRYHEIDTFQQPFRCQGRAECGRPSNASMDVTYYMPMDPSSTVHHVRCNSCYWGIMEDDIENALQACPRCNSDRLQRTWLPDRPIPY
eukprot:g15996.t1